jgi:hypothetical protein
VAQDIAEALDEVAVVLGTAWLGWLADILQGGWAEADQTALVGGR